MSDTTDKNGNGPITGNGNGAALDVNDGQDDLPIVIIAPSRWGSVVRFFAYHLPLYLIVSALVIIATPKSVVDRLTSASSTTASSAIQVSGLSLQTPRPNNPPVVESNTAEIARMTLEDSRDKYNSIKENNDRLFSLIAAMGALFAFLGFRGVDSYVTTKEAAETLVKRATRAQAEAERLRKKLDDFIANKYKEDNKAEINVTMGIVLRHVAESYEKIAAKIDPSADILVDHKYREDLEASLHYLKQARTYANVDPAVAVRAMSTMGNVYKRLRKPQEGIEILEEVLARYIKTDETIYFNIACYACLSAKDAADAGDAKTSEKMITKSISNLRKAIELCPDYVSESLTDPDFEWMRSTKNMSFKALTDLKP